MLSLSPRERELMDRLEEATETIRQLLAPADRPAWRFNGFTRSEACILAQLSEGNRCSAESLRHRLEFARPGRTESLSLRGCFIVVYRARRKLRRLVPDATIEGRGSYWMSEASIAALRPLRFE